MSRQDFRVTVKVRNNNILKGAERLGLSVPKLAEKAGIKYHVLNDLVNMTMSPFNASGAVRWQVDALCLVLGMAFDELFSSAQCEALASNRAEVEVTAEQVFALTSGLGSQAIAHDDGLADAVGQALATLTPRERTVLERHFGFHDDPVPLRELAEEWGISVERVRQIECKAMRKLRHPDRSTTLSDFVFGGAA